MALIKQLFILSILLLHAFNVFSREHDHNKHNHGHSHIHEIGISFSPIYFINAEEISVATHLHYVYNFPHTQWGVGLGYERIFDDHKHNFIGLELNYRPVHKLTLNLSPGVSFEGEHKDEKEFALHFETVYEFEFGAFHIGPALELAYHPEDYHVSLGIHIGFGL